MPGRLYTAEEKYNIIMESFQNPNITIAKICREHGIAVSLFYKWKEQFLEGGKKGLEGKDPDKALMKENESLKAIIGEMTIANEILKKKLYEEEKVSSVDEMYNNGMKISNACYYSGINRITYYYRKKHENIEDRRSSARIDNSTINKIIELCKERITYGYNRIWALLRNSGIRIARKTVYKIMEDNNLTLPVHSHKNRKELKLLRADKPEMLIETDITYIPTNNGMTYLMCIKDVFCKEWCGYNYNTSCTVKDAINAMDDSIIRKFKGVIPDNITLRTDNGPQYISKEFNSYLKTMGINHEYIERETPEENGDIESFHNSIKTDYIWINEINNFSDSKIIIENAFYDYNNIRPHSTLDYYSPMQFLDKWNNDSSFREYYRGFIKNLKDSYKRRKHNYYRRSRINVS